MSENQLLAFKEVKIMSEDIAKKRGHVLGGKFSREFSVGDFGRIIVIMRNKCVLCGSPLEITNKPVYKDQFKNMAKGAVLEFNCKFGTVKKELPIFEAVVAPDVKTPYVNKNKDKLAKLRKKLDI